MRPTCSSPGRLHSPVAWWPTTRVTHQYTVSNVSGHCLDGSIRQSHPPLHSHSREGEIEILPSVILIAAPITVDWRGTKNKRQHHQLPGDDTETERGAQRRHVVPGSRHVNPPRRLDAGHSSLAGPPTRSGRAQVFRSRISRRFSGH
jgi:hypothetical protein